MANIRYAHKVLPRHTNRDDQRLRFLDKATISPNNPQI